MSASVTLPHRYKEDSLKECKGMVYLSLCMEVVYILQALDIIRPSGHCMHEKWNHPSNIITVGGLIFQGGPIFGRLRYNIPYV